MHWSATGKGIRCGLRARLERGRGSTSSLPMGELGQPPMANMPCSRRQKARCEAAAVARARVDDAAESRAAGADEGVDLDGRAGNRKCRSLDASR